MINEHLLYNLLCPSLLIHCRWIWFFLPDFVYLITSAPTKVIFTISGPLWEALFYRVLALLSTSKPVFKLIWELKNVKSTWVLMGDVVKSTRSLSLVYFWNIEDDIGMQFFLFFLSLYQPNVSSIPAPC